MPRRWSVSENNDGATVRETTTHGRTFRATLYQWKSRPGRQFWELLEVHQDGETSFVGYNIPEGYLGTLEDMISECLKKSQATT